MADTDGVAHNSPAADAVAPPVHSRLALAAADAVMCVAFLSAWIHFACYAAVAITHTICGDHCRPNEHTAWFVTSVAAVCSWLACEVTMAQLSTYIADPDATGDAKVPASDLRSCEAAGKVSVADTTVIAAIVGALVAMAFFFIFVPLGNFKKWDSPVKGSREEKIGSALVNVGFLGMGASF